MIMILTIDCIVRRATPNKRTGFKGCSVPVAKAKERR